MIGAIRSELTRLLRRSYVLGWLGITALFGVMINAFVFSSADAGTAPPKNGPGGGIPTLAELVQPEGIVAPLGAAATSSEWSRSPSGQSQPRPTTRRASFASSYRPSRGEFGYSRGRSWL